MDINKDLVVSTDRRFLGRETASPEMLKMVGVDTIWADHVRVVDRQDNLVLLHFLSTRVSVMDHSINEELLKHIGHVRGTIIDMDTQTVVCRSLPYTPEVVSNDKARLQELFAGSLEDHTFYNACEGTVLRLFWSGETWQISTHRKINADKSYWAGPTFGKMFEELREFEMNSLNKEYCYSLLMSHDSNRLVYTIPKPQLMVIAVYNRSSGSFLKTADWGELPTGTTLPVPVTGIKTIADLQSVVNKLAESPTFDHSGIISFGDEVHPRPVKVINSEYCSIRDARGNEPSLRSRYIQIRGSPECGLIVDWFGEPDYKKIFNEAEDEIDNLVDKLHAMYVHRYIRKNFDQVTKEEFVTIQRCHKWHSSDRGNNKVIKSKVKEILDDTPNHFVLIMLNRQRQELRAAEREAVEKAKVEVETFEEVTVVHPK